jgi:hypothetical protein
MVKKILCFLFTICLLAVNFSPTLAQTYRFRVDKAEVVFYINADGTASAEYTLEFYNDPGADPLDAVDIGVPNYDYDMASVTGEINGTPITTIGASPYVKPGIAFEFKNNAISPGKSGSFHAFIGKINKMVFVSTAKEAEEYGSIEFSPSWFDSQYCYGNTDYTIVLVFPPGLKPEEPRYYTPKGWPGSAEFTESGFYKDDRAYYLWTSKSANSYTQYTFGGSFPIRLVPASAIQRAPVVNVNSEDFCCWGLFIGGLAIFVLIIIAGNAANKKRKLQYLPPKISIEGNGIKRGLTAVEAAILMEQPMDKIMTMILFSVLKKDAAEVITQDPLELKVSDPLDPTSLNAYEMEFLEAFKKPGKGDRRKALQAMMVGLVKSISGLMKGFSRRETVAYYEEIIKRAWVQVESAATPEVKMQKYDEYMGWTLLDRQYDNRTRDTFGTRPVFVPMWWGRYDPVYRSASTGGSGPAASMPSSSSTGGKSFTLPSLPGANFAGSITNGVQNFSNNILGDLTGFTNGVTNVTNPPPPPPKTSSSSSWRSGGSGGGRSCACACACAGCACACAGGGR